MVLPSVRVPLGTRGVEGSGDQAPSGPDRSVHKITLGRPAIPSSRVCERVAGDITDRPGATRSERVENYSRFFILVPFARDADLRQRFSVVLLIEVQPG